MSPQVSVARALMLIMLILAVALPTAEAGKSKKKRGKRTNKAKKVPATAASPATKPSEKSVGAGDEEELEAIEMDLDRVLSHASALTKIGPRPANSEGAKAAANYIREQVAAMGLALEEQEVGTQTVPEIDLSPLVHIPESSFTSEDPNLIVRIHVKGRSKDKPLLFMAHYDTVPNSPGAVDNAVSVGLLLELARYLKHGDPMRTIVIVWTAAEEHRMIGSEALADLLAEEVGFVVSLDLIGQAGTLTLHGLSSAIGRAWLKWLAEVSKQADIAISAPWAHRATSLLFPALERSDHAAFANRGVPAVHLYHRGEDRIYLPYHTEHDTMAQVDRASVQDAADYIVAMSDTSFSFPASGGNQGLWVPIPGSPMVSSTLAAQALEFMFLFYAIMSLVKLRREDREAAATKKKDEAPQHRRLGLMAGLGGYLLLWLLTGGLVALASSGHHALAWAHAPGRFLFGILLIAGALAYALGIGSRRVGVWFGDTRFLIPAVATSGILGFFILATGIYEVAWVFLVPSAILGGIGRAKSLMGACSYWLVATLPLLAPLAPGFLRESLFHGFYPASLGLPTYLALFVFPQSMALIFVLQRWRPALPTHKGAMVGCALAAIVGVILIASYSSPCSDAEYKSEGLACEIGR